MCQISFVFNYFLFFSLFISIVSIKNITFQNETSPLNISYIKEKIKKYEKEYMDLFIKSSKNKELFCHKIKNNIKLFKEIKNRYVLIENDIDKEFVKEIDFKEFLDVRGDISFAIRNVEIIIKKLKIKEKNCINTEEEFQTIKKEIKEKNAKNKETIINNINHILKLNNDL